MLRPAEWMGNRSERGTTLLEVMMTATLSLVVLGAVLGVFDTFVRAESGFEKRIDVEADLRLASAEFARDARSSGPPWAGDTSSQMASELTLPRFDAQGDPEVVRWTIGRKGTLERSVIGGASKGDQRQLLTNLDTDRSKLGYFAADGSELVPGRDPATVIAGCAVRVEMWLVAEDGDLSARSSARLRNVDPEAPC